MSKDTTFAKPESEKRRTPNLPDYVSMLIRFGSCLGWSRWGMSVQCGKPLYSVDVEFDHDLPLWAGGKNEPENFIPLCSDCHALKTKIEAPIRAKADRQAGRKGQVARRKKNGSKMQSQGFYKHPKKKRTIGGKVVNRC